MKSILEQRLDPDNRVDADASHDEVSEQSPIVEGAM